jgi:pantoate--beta-alanine ligase
LNAEERTQAEVLRKALLQGAEMASGGETSAARIVSAVRETIEQAPLARIDYVDVINAENLQPISVVTPNSLLPVAVFFGKTRLIDNILLA